MQKTLDMYVPIILLRAISIFMISFFSAANDSFTPLQHKSTIHGLGCTILETKARIIFVAGRSNIPSLVRCRPPTWDHHNRRDLGQQKSG
jgi:hypothetical protein